MVYKWILFILTSSLGVISFATTREGAMIKWNRLLNPQRVLVGVRSTRRFDVIRELAAVISEDEAVGDPKRFLADLIRREKQSSTGIGHGVAIPHVHEDYIHRQILAVGVVRHEAPENRVGCKDPPTGCRSSPLKLEAA